MSALPYMNGFTDARSAAKAYMDKGLAPIPLPTRSKDPGYSGWRSLRLSPSTLNSHFPEGVAKNVGILNGAPSNDTVDIDLDCPEARSAAQTLLPPTGWRFGRPSSVGSHRVYRCDVSPDTAQEKFEDTTGEILVEIRGSGGLTVYPPSEHPSGEKITWEQFTEPGQVQLGALRQAVRELAAAALIARHWPTKGSRDAAGMALAGALVRAGWTPEKTSRFIQTVAVAANDEEARQRANKAGPTARKLEDGKKTTGWPELAKLIGQDVVHRVRQWLGLVPPPKKARILEPYRTFPVETLPGLIREYVCQQALSLGCDAAYVALAVLAVLASVIGNTRVIRLKNGWLEPMVLWTAIVADSGTLKSPAWLKAVRYLFRLQKRLIVEFKKDFARYEEDLCKYKKAKQQAEDGHNPGDPPERPVLRRIICSDTTIEKLAEILEDNPRGILVTRDELAAWLGSFCRYKGKGGTDLPNWLEMHRAGTIINDRKTGERRLLYVENAATSLTGGIQPKTLARALTPEFLDSGGAARLLLAMPPKLPKQWSEAEVEPEVEQAYEDILDKLLALEFDVKDEEKVPHVLSLSPEAKAAWVEFYNSWAKEQAAVDGELAAAFSKLEACAARFTLLHHVVTHVGLDSSDLRPIGPVSVEAGTTLARWFANEARRIYAMLSESTQEHDIRRRVEFIHGRGGKISVRDLQKSNSRKYPTTEEAEAALQELIPTYGTWSDMVSGPTGGRPSKVFVLHPTVDNTDKTQEEGDRDDDESKPQPSDKTSDTTQQNIENPSVSEGFVGNVHCRFNDQDPPMTRETASSGSDGFVGQKKVLSDRSGYLLVKDRAGLEMVATAIDNTSRVALDLETTGLNPRTDKVRLLSLGLDNVDGGQVIYLVDCFQVNPTLLFERLAEKELVGHNLAFDLSFLDAMGFTPDAPIHDTMLLAQLLAAGTFDRNGLADCCERYLGKALNKDEQRSDWSGPLSESQLAYAANDVEVLIPLLRVLERQIQQAGMIEAAAIESRCLPALVWMGSKGVGFDVEAGQKLAEESERELERIRRELDATGPKVPNTLDGFTGWNWDSPAEVKKVMHLLGFDLEDTADETLATVEHPLADLLRQHRAAAKLVSSYGRKFLEHVSPDGRIYPSWKQMGAASSGRMSCSNPNMQQLPRGDYRRCVSAPKGRIMVKADYSQIELRIAAKVSGDKALLEAYQRGDDLHTNTACNVLGIQEVTKQHRQLAKALNFGLLYGMGARGFRQYAKTQYGLNLTEQEAGRYREAFFRSYPGLAAWHRRVRSRQTKETRTLIGRRRSLDDKTPDPLRLNTPIQGTGADGLKQALALLWERRDQFPGAFPVLAVHDEIVIEADEEQADAVAAWLRSAMVDAMALMINPVPVEVEVKIAKTWGGDK